MVEQVNFHALWAAKPEEIGRTKILHRDQLPVEVELSGDLVSFRMAKWCEKNPHSFKVPQHATHSTHSFGVIVKHLDFTGNQVRNIYVFIHIFVFSFLGCSSEHIFNAFASVIGREELGARFKVVPSACWSYAGSE
jgi:hypothetical protein